MKMFLADQWVERSEKIEVRSPYDDSVVDTVPRASLADVDTALETARHGADLMRRMDAYERYELLARATRLVEERSEDLARTITLEEGKIIGEARVEASRAAQTLEVSAEEAKRGDGRDDSAGWRARLRQPPGVHSAGSLWSGSRGNAIQFPAEPGGPQSGARPGRGQQRDHQAGQRHSAFRVEAHRDHARGRVPAGGRAVHHRGREER